MGVSRWNAALGLFRSRGPFMCHGRTSVPSKRAVFMYQDPEWTFLFTHASHADHSPREWTILYCLRSTRGVYPIKCMDLCPPRVDLFRSRGPFICYGQTSARPRGPFSFTRTFYLSLADLCPSHADRFHSSGPRVDFSVHSRFDCGPFSPPADLFLLLSWHTWTVLYQTYGSLPAARGLFSFARTFYLLWADICPSHADRFHLSGSRVDFSFN